MSSDRYISEEFDEGLGNDATYENWLNTLTADEIGDILDELISPQQILLNMIQGISVPFIASDEALDACEGLMSDTGFYTQMLREHAVEEFIQTLDTVDLDDTVMVDEMWKNFVDELCTDGRITEWQADNWDSFNVNEVSDKGYRVELRVIFE